MVPELIKFLRNGSTKVTHITLAANTPIQIIPRDPRRVSIVFCQAGTSQYEVSPEPLATIQDGINLQVISTAGSRPYTFSLLEHGEMVTRAWFAFSAGISVFTVFESFANEL